MTRMARMTRMSRRYAGVLASLVFGATMAVAQADDARTFRVEHDHLWGRCEGELVFGDGAVTYKASKPEHATTWKYEDIQQLEIDEGHIAILSYDTRRRDLGRDRVFRFKVLQHAPDAAFRTEMEGKLARPLVSGILPEGLGVKFSIPARHRRFAGSTQGVLEFSDDYVIFRADGKADGNDGGKTVEKNTEASSRVWRYGELLSLASTGPFRLRVGAMEKTGGEYGEEKPYNFDLKRRLTEAESDFLWEKINRPHLR